MDLTDEQWAVLEPLIPEPPRRADGRGRPWKPAREVLNGILWVLRTGAPWKDMPDQYPPYQTCHRRLQQWDQAGVMDRILVALAEDLKERGDLDLSECFIDGLPDKLIGDRAYDSDPLDATLAIQGVEIIAPHRRNRKKPKTQDGRPLRRYKRRWKVERLFAWLGNFRRLVVRCEHKIENFLAFVKLGCIIILLRKYL
jgi:transposase